MQQNRPRVLIVDDNPNMLTCLENCLTLLNYSVETAHGGEQGLAKIERGGFDLILTDLKMPGIDGMEVIRQTRSIAPDLKVIVITAFATIETAVQAIKAGAVDYITKPFKLEDMAMVLQRALRNGKGKAKRKHPAVLVGHSPAMQQLRASIEKVADSPSTVLIQGESGTGKELAARVLHAQSSRSDKPFISCSCAAFTDSLLMNELFGHVRGSYTGANEDKPGLIEMADGGTLFLDEIGETSQQFQLALLRVLAEREVQRVGDPTPIPVDFRLLTATNKNLYEEISSGRFREDLYYRLNVVNVHMPSLKERREDIPLLAEHFLRVFAEERQKEMQGFSPAAIDALQNYDWPGNVRQLESSIERAVLMCATDTLRRDDLPPEILAAQIGPEPVNVTTTQETPDLGDSEPLKNARQAFEKSYIETLLTSVAGNVSRAAEIAGVARPHFHEIMRRHQIEAQQFRQ